MSVNKHKHILRKRTGKFTTVLNFVSQGLRNAEALGLWVYMLSMPPDWEFYKEQLREHFNIGIHKLNDLIKTLEDHGLVTTAQVRDGNGRFSHFDMVVDDGENFIINPVKDLEKPKSPCYRNRNTVNRVTVITSYKRNKEQRNKEKRKQRGGAHHF